MSPTPDFDLSGRLLLDRFRVRERLDRGGMGSVWLADDVKFGLPAVIKIPTVSLLEEEGFRERFELEVKSLTTLVHPNIVRVHDFGVVDGVPFMAMQYLSGGSLKQRFERDGRRQPPESVVRWLTPIADALDAMHARRLLHRDVKPANILFDESDHAHLADFGIAKSLAAADTGLTRTGVSPGTPLYLPPEVYDGVDLAPPADQYSLALIVYEALCGEHPHAGKSLHEVIGKKLLPLPPLAEAAAGVAPAIHDVVMRALERDPARRFASCIAFAQAFERALRAAPGVEQRETIATARERADVTRVEGAAARAAPRRWFAVAAAIVVLLAGGGFIGWKAWSGRPQVGDPKEAGERGSEAAAMGTQFAKSPDAAPAAKPDDGAAPPWSGRGFTPKGRNAQGRFEYVNDATGLLFVYLEGGTFQMGSPASETDRLGDETQHPVTLSPFLIAKDEVSQEVWQKVMGSNPASFTDDPRRPVEQVTWHEAMRFCQKIDATLPTEAQWEYACRAGSTGPFPSDARLDDVAWYVIDSGRTTHSVGAKRPNAFGLCDMQGNVWEWCRDWFADYPTAAASDPLGPDLGSHRVARGGAWNVGSKFCRSAHRRRFLPGYRANDVGLRPAKAAK
jgi:formylglycine-generating enzyme required for sulfatase activity